MSVNSLIQQHQKEINRICENSGIRYLAVFGSQARNEARRNSDVDLLVEFQETPGLIEFIRTKQQFEKALNRKVDLITKNSLSKYISPYVNQDLQQIYG